MATSINDSLKKASLQIANLPTGGSIGTAATTVDRFSVFIINQTTAGQTITIPSPTDTSLSDVQEIVNVGTAMFILNGKQVNPGTTVQNVWTGTAYTTNNSGFIPAGTATNTLTTSVNTATSTVNGVVATAPIINTNVLSSSASAITSTINGVASTITPATGTIQSTLGFNATGNLVKQVVSFDSTVDFSVNANPNTAGTTFTPNTPASNTVLYISTINGSQWTYNGTTYVAEPVSADWKTTGNAVTNPATNFIGTTDAQRLAIRTNNTEKATILSNGNVGIATTTPFSTLDINGSIGTSYTQTIIAAYTATATDHTIRLANGALQTLTLPAATGIDRREYRIVNTTGFDKAFAASVTGLNGAPTTVIPGSTGLIVKSINGAWVIVEQSSISATSFATTLTTTTTTGTINTANATYMQLTGVPAGTYDVHYRMTLSNQDSDNRIWATGITFNNNPQAFAAGADAVATILGAFAFNHPYTVSGYNRVVLGATGTIEVKGQIFGTQASAPSFVGINRLTAIRVL